MEEVPEVYERLYNPNHPFLCMDEQPVQLIKETRAPIPATANHPERVDYEYERMAQPVFLCLRSLCQADAKPLLVLGGLKQTGPVEVARLLEDRYAECEKITLVCDNLNTHTKGAFYEAFAPDRARASVRRIEFCYTPEHGS